MVYDLPFGWKKVGHMRKSGENRWDFYVYSPNGQRFRSNVEIDKYLKSNPEIKCNREVTNCHTPKDLKSSVDVKQMENQQKSLQSQEIGGSVFCQQIQRVSLRLYPQLQNKVYTGKMPFESNRFNFCHISKDLL